MKIIKLLLGCIFLLISCTEEKTKVVTPNIIWLVAEDQSPEFLPMYGDSTTELPYLSSLAKDGVVFTNAYSPVPVCAPARSALISGMYPSTLGTHNMRTYNAYKKENEPSIGIPSYSPPVPEGVKMFPQYLRAKGYYTTNNAKEDYNFKKTDGVWDESSPRAHWQNRNTNQPFFAVFNFGITHESQIWGQGDQPLLVDPKTVPVPPLFPDSPEVRKDLAVNYSNLIRLDKQIGKVIEQLKTDGLYEKSIIFFYGDHGGPFPRYKRALYETGIKVPLIVKFANQEKAGTANTDFVSFIDYAPTVLSLAGIKPPPIMQGKAQFGPYEVKEKSEFIFASSDRFDEQVDRLRALRFGKFKYIRNFNPDISNAMAVSYREQMPMMQYLNQLWEAQELEPNAAAWFKTPKPKEELYNLEQDPYELNNLASEVGLQDTLTFLRTQMDKWIFETQDLGEFSEKTLINKWFPEGKRQKLVPVTTKIQADKIVLEHPDKGATIVWKKNQDTVWSIYSKPLDTSKSLQAKAVRIGYDDSSISTLN
ncbi:MAG: sulfatase [Flavobacteriaceae bacterium]|jgi:arylsulfatase A-like enzyme|nr:sulfatase [Flavobacteriaceae bacterium]